MSEIPPPDAPSTGLALLAQARQESSQRGELLKLIMGGTRRIDSWLIEHRVLPALARQEAKAMQFTLSPRNRESRSATLIPLPDGSAFARSTTERWSVLAALEAGSAIQYIGLRYAPGDHWANGFAATLLIGGQLAGQLKPFEVAALWQEVTGQRPAGFATGMFDEMGAFGLRLIGPVFNTQGRLGL